MKSLLLATICLWALLHTAWARSALYNTTAGRVPGKLNVHVVSHTHNDPGWLFDYVQYYRAFVLDGHRFQGVEGILDTAVHALLDNPDRTWVYADLAFFIKWWQELHADTKKVVRRLVKQGRWEFTNGGITQHDEATSHYGAMVDQMTVGMRFLFNEFGVQPKIAWQLDGFGHSNTEPLLKAMGGFEAVVFGRSDQQDFEQRRARHQLELVWRGSQSFGRESELFTSQYPTGNYGPPTMNWFFERRDDYAKRTFDGVMDDPESREYNLNQAVEDFVAKAKEWQSCTQGDDVMFLFGSDFTHGDARSWFHNVDKLIHYANKDGRVNAFYSTPSRYLAAKQAGSEAWALKEDDFFPYCANNQGVDFWTGYFASRPTLKGQVRRATALLQATRQVEVLAEMSPSNTQIVGTSRGKSAPGAADGAAFVRSSVLLFGNKLSPDADTAVLEYAVAMALHHDGLTGTSRLAVIKDYMSWLHVGMEKAVPKFLGGLQRLLYKDTLMIGASGASHMSATATSPAALSIYRRLTHEMGGQSPAPAAAEPPRVPELSMCLMLNASVCASSVTLSTGGGFLVVVYNPLSWTYKWGVRIPVSQGSFSVEGPDGKVVPSQLLPLPSAKDVLLKSVQGFIAGLNVTASAELAFLVSAPPLGHATYKVLRTADSGAPSPLEALNATDAKLSTGVLDVLISQVSRAICSVTLADKTMNVTHGVIIYQGHHMSGTGAYTFKANQAHERAPKHEVYVVRGPVVQEVREVYKDLGTLVTRLWQGTASLEVEWTLGPPPKNMNWEAFIRYESSIQSGDLWFTDANGREWQQRARQYRPAYNLLPSSHRIPGNIYPVTSGAFIKDNSSAMFVAIDRAQGCASLNSGELDFLVHRASSGDDGKGMREPLIEENVAAGTHIISFGNSAADQVHVGSHPRHFQQVLVDPLQLAFSALPTLPYDKMSSGLVNAAAKPRNVHVLTLKWLSCNNLLLRLSHMFMTGEHPSLSNVAEVQLDKLLHLKMERIVEATLYGERPLVEADRQLTTWRTGTNLTKWRPPLNDTGMTGPMHSFLTNRIVGPIKVSTPISLSPMQIRTFHVTVSREHSRCSDPLPIRDDEEEIPLSEGQPAAAAVSRHEDEQEEAEEPSADPPAAIHHSLSTLEAAEASMQPAVDPHMHPLDQMRRSSAALLYRVSHGSRDRSVHLSPSALLAMLVLPFTAVFLIAYALFNRNKR